MAIPSNTDGKLDEVKSVMLTERGGTGNEVKLGHCQEAVIG